MSKSSASIQRYIAGVVTQVVTSNNISSLVYNQQVFPKYITDSMKYISSGSVSPIESGVTNIPGALIYNNNLTSITGSGHSLNTLTTSANYPSKTYAICAEKLAFEIDTTFNSMTYPLYMANGTTGTFEYHANDTPNFISITNTNLLFPNISYTHAYLQGVIRNHAVKVNPNGNLQPWNPNAILNIENGAGPVYTMAQINNLIYMGGWFNTIGNASRFNIACVDNINGQVTSWNPSCNNIVNTIAISANNIYIGGEFTTVNNYARGFAACVDVNNNLLDWNPGCNGYVRTMVCNNNLIYLGGNFESLTNIVPEYFSRQYIACVDSISGQVTSWNPSCDRYVNTMAIHNNKIYLGGEFRLVGGLSRNRAACVDINNNILQWNPNCDDYVVSIAYDDDKIYLGGSFRRVGGLSRNRAACVDISGQLTSWNPNLNDTVFTIVPSGTKIYLGGGFTSVGSSANYRLYMTCVDNVNGTSYFDWNTTNSVFGQVNCMLLSDDNYFYIGGYFNGINTYLLNTSGNLALNESATYTISGNGKQSFFTWTQN